jgi:uncharacterized protein
VPSFLDGESGFPMFSLQTIFGSGKQFYTLLDEAAQAAQDSAKALHAMLRAADRQPALDAFKLARLRERAASDKISQALVDSFMTPIEREDIEALGSALYKIPKQIEKFADRYSLATTHLEHIDFAPRAAMLEQAAGVVVEMVGDLRHMNLDRMTATSIPVAWTTCRCSCSRNSSRSWKRPSTAAARRAWWPTRSC